MCAAAVLAALPGVTPVLQPVVLQLSPAARLWQAGLGLFSSEQFCLWDNESQLWQKATSAGQEAEHRVVVLPSAFQSRFQKVGQGRIKAWRHHLEYVELPEELAAGFKPFCLAQG